MTAVYVYGVVPASASVEPGSDGPAVETVAHGPVAALVTPRPDPEARLGRGDALRHSDVLQRAIATTTVLPLRFGTVLSSREAVVDDFLAPRRDELAELLEELDGSVEMSFKAVLREDVHLAELVARDREVARLREATRRAPEAASYHDRIRLGELVAAALADRRAEYERRVLETLAPLALETVVADEPRGHGEVAVAFLVARTGVPAFEEAAQELARREADGLECKLLGPLPPYSFVGLERSAA